MFFSYGRQASRLSALSSLATAMARLNFSESTFFVYAPRTQSAYVAILCLAWSMMTHTSE